jgi:predicted dehydrogenase
MMRIAVIGAGSHSWHNHLPALSCAAAGRPDVTLGPICDLDGDLAQRARDRFGFASAWTSLDEMFEAETIDACIAVTPMSVTAEVAGSLLGRNLPLLMEKPLAADIDQARQLVAQAAEASAAVMVSLNRRFEPAVTRALEMLQGQDVRYVHASMLRTGRDELRFIRETAIHAVDTARMLGGTSRSPRATRIALGQAFGYLLEWELPRGLCRVEILPTAGVNEEVYRCFTDESCVTVRSALFDAGRATWHEKERLVERFDVDPDAPLWERNGTLAETEAFLDVAAGRRPSGPTPADALEAMELCELAVEARLLS